MKYEVFIFERNADSYHDRANLLKAYRSFEEYEDKMVFVVDTETGAFEVICNKEQLSLAAAKLLYMGELR
jgi:hypothetical protein